MWQIFLSSQRACKNRAVWRLLCVGAFCIFPGVYSLKRRINISMDDLIIVKHTHVLGCVRCMHLWARECARFWGAASFICMSGANIYHHHQGAAKQWGRQAPPTLSGERLNTLSNLYRSDIKRFLNAFTSGQRHTAHTHAQMQTDRFCFMSFFSLCSSRL